MKITREETLPTEITLNIELEPDDLEPYLDRAYRRVVKKVNVPGFRKGKAPRPIVESLIGREQLLHEALDFLVPESVDQAVRQEEIEPYVQPDVDVTNMDPLSIKATVPLEPQIVLSDYLSLRIDAEPVTVADDRVDEVLERLRDDSGPWEPVDRPAQFNDLLTLDVEGTVEGRTVASDTGIDYIPSMENMLPLPGFSAHIEGAKRDESKSFSLMVPDDYSDNSIASKECLFQIHVHEIKEKVLPDLDDEFAKGVGEGYENLQTLKESVLQNLIMAAQRASDQELHDKALQQVIEGTVVELPDLVVDRDVDNLMHDQARALEARRVDMDTYLQQVGKSEEELRLELRPVSRERLIRSLVLKKLAQDQGIEATVQETDAEVKNMFAGSNVKDKAVRRAMSSQGVRASIESSIVARKTLERLGQIVQGKEHVSKDSVAGEQAEPLNQGGTESVNKS